MIPKYIKNWLTIVEQMINDNTYKPAWGRAVVECICFDDYINNDDKVIVTFDSISLRMLKYYWNQIFFFNLKQDPYTNKNSSIPAFVGELISIYKSKNKTTIPLWFDKAYAWFIKNDSNDLTATIKKIVTILPQNVAHRFLTVGKISLAIYELNKKDKRIIFTKKQVKQIKDYSVVISKLLNYKWAQLLEQYNCSPRIASKVNGISEAKLRRNSLTKYKDELLKEFKGGKPVDFYTGKPLDNNDISVDHVIPWSFMYSDDIWNLVLTSKSNNSKKSNSIPTQDTIDRLNERNKQLDKILDGKMKLHLDEAIDNKYVDKFYFQCRL